MAKTVKARIPGIDLQRDARVTFHQLADEIAAVEARLEPYRQAKDAKEAEAQRIKDEQQAIADQIKAIEDETSLAEMKQRQSEIVVFLGGKTGNPDGTYQEPSQEERDAMAAGNRQAQADAEDRARQVERDKVERNEQRDAERAAQRDAARQSVAEDFASESAKPV